MPEPPLEPKQVLGLVRQQLPRHVAIIMDGNGRWAAHRGLPRMEGHARGAQGVRAIVTHCARLHLEVLTLFCFSTENWKRPKEEVEFLMRLYLQHLIGERATIMDNNVRFLHLGRREGLPDFVLEEMDRTIEMSLKNTGLKLCLALNYGGRDEIVDAVRAIALDVQGGRVAPQGIDETTISNALYSRGLPDPDLLIRTAGEMRISNFLLWQISYAELYVCDKEWPEFTSEDLNEAMREFGRRERRFGDVRAGGQNAEC